MKKLSLLAILASSLFFVSCSFWNAPVVPPQGMIYSNTSAPISTNFDSADLGSKKGEAYAEGVLGLVAWGDASVHTAAKDGDLQVIEHVDYEMLNVLGIYTKFTTKVYGK